MCIRDSPYVEEHINYTRIAYGLDQIEERPFEASSSLSQSDINDNSQTVDNIRLWDPTVLAETYSQLQEIRAYYALKEVDVDRYVIDGKLTQVMVSARELDQTNLPAQGWVNQGFNTHMVLELYLVQQMQLRVKDNQIFMLKGFQPAHQLQN